MDDTSKADDATVSGPEPLNLRFLRILVTVLTATMILGLITIVVIFVTRFPGGSTSPSLPAAITLPDGTSATAFTVGPGWYAVITETNEILIFDQETGALRQTIIIE